MGRKTTLCSSQVTNKRYLTQENLDMAKKEKPLEGNWISSDSSTKQRHKDNVKVRIDKTQQNSRCTWYGDRDEMINHIISECSKLARREDKTRHDWVGKGIHWELCKKSKFDHTNKWYMYDPESVQENETHKPLCDFEIQTDNLILTDVQTL